MIDFNQIEQELGVQTLMTDKQQAAIENWYRVAIKGEACDRNPDTKALGLPAAICTELARLTTLELEINVQGSQRADWINRKMQKVMSPRRRRILSVALALGSGAWKPYQAGNDIGVSFVSADSIYPISTNTDGELTEVVFVNRIQDSKNVYNRLEWMHVLLGPEDYHDKERDILEARDVAAAAEYPCVQVINLAFMGSTHNELGTAIGLDARPEWKDVEPIAYLPGLDKVPCGYFVTPIVNTVDPNNELGAAIFAPGIPEIIDADVQFTRLDWEYEGGELGVDVDENYLVPIGENGAPISDEESLRRFGVPAQALNERAPEHAQRLFRGMNINTGIADGGTFYQIFAPSLRDGNYLSGLNQYLRHVESKCGLSFGVLSQVAETEKTATEIISSRQKLYATVSDIQAALEDALRGLIAALDFWADQLDTVPAGAGAPEISFKWDESIIIDRQTEMVQWQSELQLGLRSKVEYRQHFYGEDEATAQQAIAAIQQESMATDILQGVLTNGSSQNDQKSSSGKKSSGKAR